MQAFKSAFFYFVVGKYYDDGLINTDQYNQLNQ